MIVSVPHTGTRTLQRWLGETQLWHFGQCELAFEPLWEHIDFPIRCPLATSLSWRAFQSERTDMGEFHRWELAIKYLGNYEPGVTIHVIEKLPVLEGKSSDSWFRQAYLDHDIDALRKLPEVEYLLGWYPSVEEFFKPHYGEFWWQQKQATPSS